MESTHEWRPLPYSVVCIVVHEIVHEILRLLPFLGCNDESSAPEAKWGSGVHLQYRCTHVEHLTCIGFFVDPKGPNGI